MARRTLTVVAAAWLWAAGVRAQDASPFAVIAHDGARVPRDGVVLVLAPPRGRIGAEAVAVPTRIAVTLKGAAVAGSQRNAGWIEDTRALALGNPALLGAAVVWAPDQPLDVGATYDVEVSPDPGDLPEERSVRGSFSVVDPLGDEPPTLELGAQLVELHAAEDEVHCCHRLAGVGGGEGCFVARYKELPGLALSVESSSPVEHLRQFVYSYEAWVPDTDSPSWSSAFRTYDSPTPTLPFLELDETYCVELLIRRLRDDTISRLRACVDASESSHEFRDPAPGIEAGLALERCAVPDYADVLQWCEQNRAMCRAAEAPAACQSYSALCEGELVDAFDFIQRNDDALEAEGARDTTDAEADAGMLGDASHDAMGGAAVEPANSATGGCGCTVGARAEPVESSGLAALLWASLCVVTLRSRRARTHRGPGCARGSRRNA